MNERIEFLKKELFRNKREISIERAVLYTESHKQTENLPEIIRRAKVTENILKKMEIGIREKEIIAGNRTIKPRAGIISPEMDPYWILKEIDTIDTRPQDRFIFKEDDKKIFLEELYTYWEKKSLKDSLNGESRSLSKLVLAKPTTFVFRRPFHHWKRPRLTFIAFGFNESLLNYTKIRSHRQNYAHLHPARPTPTCQNP